MPILPVVISLLISFILSVQTWALDPESIYNLDVCKNKKSQYTSDQIQQMKEARQFIGPHDSLNMFEKNIEQFNQWTQKNTSCSKIDISPFGKNNTPLPIQHTLQDLTKEITKLIQQDIQNQEKMIDLGLRCSEIMRNKKSLNLEKSDFPEEIASSCEAFSKKFVPGIQKRLHTMRTLMPVAFDDAKDSEPWGQNLEHDKSFSDEFMQNFFPTIWKKDSVSKLKPLSDTELVEAKKNREKLTKDEAESRYYTLISTTPLLLFFNNEVTPDTLHHGLSQIKKQNHFDQKSLIEKPSQNLFLMTAYLEKALENMPKSQQGDACLVVSEVYKNLIIKHVNQPMFTAQMGLMLSVLSGPQGYFGKKLLGTLPKRLSATYFAAVAPMNLRNFQKYQEGVAMCSNVMAEKHAEPDLMTFCNTQGLNQIYSNTQTNLMVSTAVGTGMSTLGLVRLYRSKFAK